jgi:hypothetical protein
MKTAALFTALFAVLTLQSRSQTAAPPASGTPLWLKDLRRAEIVAFGSFPFTMLMATAGMDTYRFISHNGDSRYTPLIKSPGAVTMNEEELGITLAVAGAASLAIALADFVIVQYKRRAHARRVENLPPGTPIIIRKPLPLPDGAGRSEP